MIAYTAIFIVLLQLINAWVHGITPRAIAQWARGQRPEVVDCSRFARYGVLSLPYGSYGYSKTVQRWLWCNKKVAPEYFMGGMGIYTESQMRDRLKDMDRFDYALILDYFGTLSAPNQDACSWHRRYVHKAFLYPWQLPCPREALVPDVEIARYLDRHFHVAERVGDYVVLERTDRKKPVN